VYARRRRGAGRCGTGCGVRQAKRPIPSALSRCSCSGSMYRADTIMAFPRAAHRTPARILDLPDGDGRTVHATPCLAGIDGGAPECRSLFLKILGMAVSVSVWGVDSFQVMWTERAGQTFFSAHPVNGDSCALTCGYSLFRGLFFWLSTQTCPQAAHRIGGVSAQPVHRPVHSMIGRRVGSREKCQTCPLERV
jgi:hypothetical protein